MTPHAAVTPRWSTSSFGHFGASPAPEMSDLREHLSRCRGARGRWFMLHCAAEVMNGYLASRFVTTLAVASVFIGAAVLLA